MKYYIFLCLYNKLLTRYKFALIGLFFFLTSLTGCKKFLHVSEPATAISSSSVYSNNTSAAAVVTSIYENMIEQGGLSSGQSSISALTGLSSDELKNYSTDPVFSGFYSNSLLASNFNNFWPELYREIYVANAAINGLSSSASISPAIKSQLIGEAKFMRGFLLFYATCLFGDVPVVTTNNYQINNSVARSTTSQVYEQIILDLKDAQSLLTDKYLTPSGTVTSLRVRPNKGAAEALLARVYLFTGDWSNAEILSDSVISNTAIYSLPSDLNEVFLTDSPEAIWQLQSVSPGANTWDGYFFVLSSPPGTGYYFCALDSSLVNSFEPNDLRLVNWVGQYNSGSDSFYFPNKYKIGTIDVNNAVTEYTMVLRLAEQYLIRAEARARKGSNLIGAIEDLNVVRNRAGLSPLSLSLSQSAILKAIAQERRIELFTEWGHRWFDLKRTGAIDSVMSIICPKKGGIWNSNWSLYPIPQTELLLNKNLTQNSGY